jgi:hypothetical protein
VFGFWLLFGSSKTKKQRDPFLDKRRQRMQRNNNSLNLRTALWNALRNSWNFNRPITLGILFHVVLIPVALIAAVVDPKVILGAPAWIKPLKFAISGSVYLATFAWFLTFVRGRRWLVQTAATVTGIALIVESTLISLQVVRGVASHFNESTPFDALVFDIMGGFIVLVSVFNLILAILLLLQRLEDPVWAWGLRLGVLISFIGMAVAFLMVDGPTPEQQAALDRGETLALIGAHSVGVPDGGPGLPLVGWSTEGGDLRIGHFLGLHGIQALPFLAWLLNRPAMRRRYSQGRRTALVWIGGIAYTGLTFLVTWQALRGQPLIAPDALTLEAFALLAVGVTLATMVVLVGGSRKAHPLATTRYG